MQSAQMRATVSHLGPRLDPHFCARHSSTASLTFNPVCVRTSSCKGKTSAAKVLLDPRKLDAPCFTSAHILVFLSMSLVLQEQLAVRARATTEPERSHANSKR
eukprot:4716605-Amphidinium_carterae.1